jgi:hypothetical protein
MICSEFQNSVPACFNDKIVRAARRKESESHGNKNAAKIIKTKTGIENIENWAGSES